MNIMDGYSQEKRMKNIILSSTFLSTVYCPVERSVPRLCILGIKGGLLDADEPLHHALPAGRGSGVQQSPAVSVRYPGRLRADPGGHQSGGREEKEKYRLGEVIRVNRFTFL